MRNKALRVLQAHHSGFDPRNLAAAGIRPVAGASGTATWTIVPATNAAPLAPIQFSVGGSYSYVVNGEPVTVPLFPVPITVLPTPIFNVDYFLEHDVYSDDPFTAQT